MIQPRTNIPSPEELLGRAAALVPVLRENALNAEQLRRLPGCFGMCMSSHISTLPRPSLITSSTDGDSSPREP